MRLCINMVLEWQLVEENPCLERILWIDTSYTDVVTIELLSSQALPVWKKCQELEEAIVTNHACVSDIDPYAYLLRPEDSIPAHHRERRDRAWEIIAPLIQDNTGAIFTSDSRGILISKRIEQTGASKTTIYKHLRRYWQAGQTLNALLPLFEQCGAPGKERQATEKKRGRPTKISKVTQMPRGINVDDSVREKFKRGIDKFYLNTPGRTLQDAYQKTLETYFHKGYSLLPNGTLVPCLPPAYELPTFGQFRYWYEKERDIEQSLFLRQGKRQYNLKHREVLGDSTQMAFGPGSIYQIDATIGDIYLVSSLDRTRIIGRPVIYMLIDVFSRMITGFSVGLEGPSWLGAMQALENAATNKVGFCKEYDIEITEEDWPCHHLPETIIADRGELEGYNADNLVKSLNINISNTPPYRADWKGIVERNFRLANDKFIHWIPGAVNKPRERGDRDYRLDAVLDLHQFRKLMILAILGHNRDHRMDWYRMDEFMIQDHIEPYPIDLWNWGIINRSGHLRVKSRDVLRLNLLPSGEATVTHHGIHFQGLFYSCNLAIQEQWFVRARERGSWKIPVAYDPRSLSEIYLRLHDGQKLEICQLIDAEKTFLVRDIHEAQDYFETRKQQKELARSRKQQSKAALNAQVEQIISEATQQTVSAQERVPLPSKRSRTQGIRENRKHERDQERIAQAWRLGRPVEASQGEVIPISLISLTQEPEDTREPNVNISEEVVNRDPGFIPKDQLIKKMRQLRSRSQKDNE